MQKIVITGWPAHIPLAMFLWFFFFGMLMTAVGVAWPFYLAIRDHLRARRS